MESIEIEIVDELSGFYPGAEGTALVVHEQGETLKFITKYAVDVEDDPDGWEWGLGGTYLSTRDVAELRDFLNDWLGGK